MSQVLVFQSIGFVCLIILSALFSSAEVAYTALTMSQIKRVHRFKPGFFRVWEKSPDRILAVLLLSNNSVNIGVGVLAGSISLTLARQMGWKESLATLLMGFLSGLVILIFGEIIPKVWAKQASVSWALTVTPLMNFWSTMVSPLARGMVWITNKILLGQHRRMRGTPFIKSPDLKNILIHSTIPISSKDLLDNIIDFSKLKVEDVMVPRQKIMALSVKEPIPNIINRVVQSGLSRIPIYSGHLDQLLGLLYVKDLLIAWRSDKLIVLEDLLRPLLLVDQNQSLTDLLRIFKTGRHHMAIIREPADKKRVKGLITLEDALEAIVGEIKEEI